MKVFYVKFLSFFSVIIFSLLLTSCTKDNDIAESTEKQNSNYNDINLLLPQTISGQEEVVIKSYLENISINEMIDYMNNFKIYTYLSEIGKLNHFSSEFINGILHDTNFSIHLTNTEIKELEKNLVLKNIEDSEDELRSWCCYSYYGPYCDNRGHCDSNFVIMIF